MRFSTVGVTLHADDVEVVAAFYRDHLDLEPVLDIGWFVSLRPAGREVGTGVEFVATTTPDPQWLAAHTNGAPLPDGTTTRA